MKELTFAIYGRKIGVCAVRDDGVGVSFYLDLPQAVDALDSLHRAVKLVERQVDFERDYR